MLGYDFTYALNHVTESYNDRHIRMYSWEMYPLRYKQLVFLQKMIKDIYIDIQGDILQPYYNWLTLHDLPDFYKYIVTSIDNNHHSSNNNKLYLMLYNHLYNKIILNKELFYRLKFTYLKKINISNQPNKILSQMYTKILHRLREFTLN